MGTRMNRIIGGSLTLDPGGAGAGVDPRKYLNVNNGESQDSKILAIKTMATLIKKPSLGNNHAYFVRPLIVYSNVEVYLRPSQVIGPTGLRPLLLKNLFVQPA